MKRTFSAPPAANSGRHVQGSLTWSFSALKNYDTGTTVESKYMVGGSYDLIVPGGDSCHKTVSIAKSVANAQISHMNFYSYLKPTQRLAQSPGIPLNLVYLPTLPYCAGSPFALTFSTAALNKLWHTVLEPTFTFQCTKQPTWPRTVSFNFDKTVGPSAGLGLGPLTTHVDSSLPVDAPTVCNSP